MKKQRIIWMMVWLLLGCYFVVAGIGIGAGGIAIGSIVCGFMSARNMADVVAT